MYISVYDENLNHLSNVTDTTHELTVRVYDNDTFSAEGICDEDINNAKIAVLNDDNGKYIYACFTDGITPAKSKRTIKGLDFKTLWDTEILLDYTKENSFDARLSSIFAKVKEAVFETSDVSVCKIPVKVNIPLDETDTSEVYNPCNFMRNSRHRFNGSCFFFRRSQTERARRGRRRSTHTRKTRCDKNAE